MSHTGLCPAFKIGLSIRDGEPRSSNEGITVGATGSRIRVASDTKNVDTPPEPLQPMRANPQDPGRPAEYLDTLPPEVCTQHVAIAVRKANELAEELHRDFRIPVVWDSDGARVLHTHEAHRPRQVVGYKLGNMSARGSS